jgi:hypothetical protein
MDMVYLMRDGREVACRQDRHILGLFSNDTWLRLIEDAGFTAAMEQYQLDEDPPVGLHVFLGTRPEKAVA